jgi:hypothetical protein
MTKTAGWRLSKNDGSIIEFRSVVDAVRRCA